MQQEEKLSIFYSSPAPNSSNPLLKIINIYDNGWLVGWLSQRFGKKTICELEEEEEDEERTNEYSLARLLTTRTKHSRPIRSDPNRTIQIWSGSWHSFGKNYDNFESAQNLAKKSLI